MLQQLLNFGKNGKGEIDGSPKELSKVGDGILQNPPRRFGFSPKVRFSWQKPA